jgi:MFS family permease
MTLSSINQAIPTLAEQMHWGDKNDVAFYGTILQTVTNLGMAVGSLIGGKIIIHGRRRAILISTYCSFIFLIPSVIEVYWLMVFCKFGWGTTCGIAYVTVVRMIEEIVPTHLMKRLGPFMTLSFSFGSFLMLFLGLLLPFKT